MDVRIAEKKMGIELFTDSHVERKKSNKNFKKSGFKNVREKIGRNSRSIIQEFVEITGKYYGLVHFPEIFNWYPVYLSM